MFRRMRRCHFVRTGGALSWPMVHRTDASTRPRCSRPCATSGVSGDIWVERSSGYRQFESYLLPSIAVPAAAAKLGLPATADEWLAMKGVELDRRLKRFARGLRQGNLEGVEFRDDRLHITPVKAGITPEGRAFADTIETMMPVCASPSCSTR